MAPTIPFLRPKAAAKSAGLEVSAEAVLSVRGLVRHFGGIKSVDGVDFTVRDRSLHALIGPNGAGKTTTFNLVSGMFAPQRGTVCLGARSIGGCATSLSTDTAPGGAACIALPSANTVLGA